MASAADPPQSNRWFVVPRPIRNLFNHFPLHVYDPEDLPVRSPPTVRQRPALYVFVADDDALAGRPSYNPSCLKWQTVLKIAGIEFDIVPSNNHASPSGALPFLLPSSSRPSKPLTGSSIHNYAREHTVHELTNISSPRLEAYQALLTQNIRPAWLYALYLLPANAPLLKSLYLPSSVLLRTPLHQTLYAAATAEILKTTRRATISSSQLFSDATTALRALSSLLGDDKWFFGAEGPDRDALAWGDKTLNSAHVLRTAKR
ncbi:hypothetical protein F53441_7892 [Fusarium austroafricanum]|uniref:Thioredoxin-like fold domain-containing protein n=1 Tax=Fusarium austroafricanum TaxID=2364996 RepID=A0A8H4KFD9_9HYPO|nr:hypothetical protein F53441_7892 [Fusarium austroafricanum]